MRAFMDSQDLPPLGRLKCVWVPGPDGRLESIWVPDWEQAAADELLLLAESADAV
jgi:hypothetical protein